MPDQPQRSDLWVVLHDRPNATVENLLRLLAPNEDIDLSQRPRAALEWTDVGPRLEVEDADLLVRSLRRKELTAMTTLPVEACRELHGQVLVHEAVRYEISWRGADPDFAPFSRRQIVLRRAGVLGPGGLDRFGCIARSESPRGAPLFLRPERLRGLSDEQLGLVFGPDEAWRNANVLFLPPTRGRLEGTYFDAEPRFVRKALRARLESIWDQDRPTCLRAWTILDDPDVRDVLLDGGHLEMVESNGEPTGLRLVLNASAAKRPDSYRTSFLADPSFEEPTGEFGELASSIRGDVAGLSVSLVAERKSDARDWSQPRQEIPRFAGTHDGTHKQLESLAGLLDDRASKRFRNEVTAWTVDQQLGRDNAAAEARYLASYWRDPSGRIPADPAWRDAAVDLVSAAISANAGDVVDPAQRIDAWGRRSGWPRLQRNVASTVEHRVTDSDRRRRAWRWSLPLDWVLRTSGTLHLDDPSTRLDEACLG